MKNPEQTVYIGKKSLPSVKEILKLKGIKVGSGYHPSYVEDYS